MPQIPTKGNNVATKLTPTLALTGLAASWFRRRWQRVELRLVGIVAGGC